MNQFSNQLIASPPFHSILFDESEVVADVEGRTAPDFFTDLNLDQIVESIAADRGEYNLKPFFYIPLSHLEAIEYRHEILLDLENETLAEYVRSFAQYMRKMRGHLAQADKLHYKLQKQRWFLDAASVYCDAVDCLTHDLTRTDLRSRGFLAFRQYLTRYTASTDFVSLAAEAQKLKTDLSGIEYCLRIEGNRIKIDRYGSEPDYGADVLQTFERFKQGAVKEYRFDFFSLPDMNHVEAAILDIVAKLYPDIFSSLDEYCSGRHDYIDSIISKFDREVQFYLAYLEYLERFKPAGLQFCYPIVSDQSKDVYGCEIFDIALANKLIREDASVVTNDFFFRDPERIFVVSGPNQGGKTTFARTFGQLHYLAAIGCPVPGTEAKLFLFDRLFTHFEKEEDIQNLSSKLEDDLLRIHGILEQATPNSILIMNESFVSTTSSDALFLSRQIMQQLIERDMLVVTVTFLDELASLGETTVSMVSTVNPENPARRTFKIVRRPADGVAYAAAIAGKYCLTYENVKRRISS
jgi:DNA mismatch repair ATPase MutS